MTQHTPGPWYAIMDTEETPHRCMLITCEPEGDEVDISTEANSRLIAAAPEMLEALKLALDMDRLAREGKPTPVSFFLGKVRTVIAKAEGN